MTDSPHLLGEAHQTAMAAEERTRRGVWFTPETIAGLLTDAALSRWKAARPIGTVTDAACGGASFLLAAHQRLPEAHLRGVDVDEATCVVAREALNQAAARSVTICQGDGLDPAFAQPSDLVLGNPPFLSQLQASTSRGTRRREQLRGWYGDAARGYVDDAGLFLLAASRMLSDGGVAVLIVPEALLATASAAQVRASVSAMCRVEVVWRDTTKVFPGVQTCAVALTRTRQASPQSNWSHLLADGVPTVMSVTTQTIGGMATATADFRDAYYLVAQHVAEARAGHDDPRITPVGLIDPAHHRWGQTSVRFAKARFDRPVAIGLEAGFLEQRLGPKLLVATQTRVLEALVDLQGDLLPTTPAITVRTDRVWHVGAALTSPVLTAVAARRHAGAARSRTALKLSARQVLALPLPDQPTAAWDEAAQAYRDAHAADGVTRRSLLDRCGRLMWEAFGLPEDESATQWWMERLPRR